MLRLADIKCRLESLPIAETQAAALADAGEVLAAAVREALSVRPGGAHETPWVETGTLHESIGVAVDGDSLIVGSDDPVAADQEQGTRVMPARPFLAPVAVALGERVAAGIGARFAELLRLDG